MLVLSWLVGLLVPQIGHSTAITDVVFTPDGQSFVTSGSDMTIRFWNLASGFEYLTLRGHKTPVNALDITRDGEFIISAASSKEVILWRKSGALVRRIQAHDSTVNDVAFHPSGELFATASSDGKVKLWKKSDGSLVRTHQFGPWNFNGATYDENEKAMSVTFSPDGKSLLASGMPGFIASWAVDSGKQTALWGLRDEKGETMLDAPKELTLSPDGRWLACGFGPFSNDAYLVDLKGMKIAYRFKGHTGSVEAIAISPNGQQVLTGARGPKGAETRVWDIATGKLIRTQPEDGREVDGLAVSPDGKTYVSVGDSVTVSDMPSGRLLQKTQRAAWPVMALSSAGQAGAEVSAATRDGAIHRVDSVGMKRSEVTQLAQSVEPYATSADGKLVVAWHQAKRFALWDAHTGKELRRFPETKDATYAHAALLSADGKWAYTVDSQSVLMAVRTSDGQLAWSAKAGRTLALSNNGDLLAVPHAEGVTVHHATTGKVAYELVSKMRKTSYAAAFSPDGQWLAVGGGDAVEGNPELVIWELASKKIKHTLQGHESAVKALAFDATSRRLASGSGALYNSEPFPVRVWDPTTGKETARFAGHTYDVTSLVFVGAHLWSASMDATIQVHRFGGPGSVTLLANNSDWLAIDDEGHFDGSPNSGRLSAVYEGGRVYSIDQFAVRSNRPDLLLARMGLGNADMIQHYRAQYQRRLNKLGVTEDAVIKNTSAGEATLTAAEQNGRVVLLRGDLKSAAGLRSFQIFVNDVPVFAGEGKTRQGTQASFEERVTLNPGRNKVEVSAIDKTGRESLRAIRTLLVDGKLTPDLYFLGFGVSKYKQADLTLAYAHQDALDLEAAFKKMKGFGHIYTQVYQDEQVTVDAIKSAKGFAMDARPEDVFVVFIAGHGVHDNDANNTYYYLTQSADVSDLSKTAAPFELVEDLLVGTAARSKLFLMDTCESGEVDDTVAVQVGAQSSALASRGIKKTAGKGTPSVSAFVLKQKDRFIYNDLLRRSGAIVFSSSRGGERSYERADLANGLFTESLLTALQSPTADLDRDGAVSVDELRSFVVKDVARASDEQQHPTVDRDNLFQKFSFPLVPATR